MNDAFGIITPDLRLSFLDSGVWNLKILKISSDLFLNITLFQIMMVDVILCLS